MSVYLVPAAKATPDTPVTIEAPCSAAGCGCAHRVARYPSDMTDPEWAVLEPQARAVMAELRRGPGGRPMVHRLRAVVDAVRYLVRYGVEWRALPVDFPPWEAVYAFFERWAQRGLPRRIVDRLRDQLRVGAAHGLGVDDRRGRQRGAVGAATSGYDAGKKTKGRKRHIAVDANGWLLAVLVTAASVQDRDAGHQLLALLRERFSTITLAWADGGYAGRLITWAAHVLTLAVTVVKRTDDVRGFVVLPRRWGVERTFGWLCRHRRLVRDYERRPEHHEAMIWWATIAIMTRQLVAQHADQPPPPRWGTERVPEPPHQRDQQAA